MSSKMDCEQIREKLEAYALGALDADEQARVEQHLAECAECRQLAAEYAETVNRLPQALATASPLTLPASLKDRVVQSLPGEQPALSQTAQLPSRQPGTSGQWALRRPRLWAAVAGIAALLLVVLLAWNAQLNVALAQERSLRAA